MGEVNGNMEHLHCPQVTLSTCLSRHCDDFALQSSSLSTTAIIALVASGAIPLTWCAIACVLRANIGTTERYVSSLLVSDARCRKQRYIANSDSTHCASIYSCASLLPFAHHSKIFIKNNLKKIKKKLETLVLQGLFYALFCVISLDIVANIMYIIRVR